MAEFSVKTEPELEVKSTPEDQQTQQESTKTTSFCFESVVKEEVMIEDVFDPSDAESDNHHPSGIAQDTQKDMFCQECNKTFTNRALFISHMKKDRFVREGKYTCQICEKRFRDKYALTIHLQGVHLIDTSTTANESGGFKCTECDETFKFQYLQQQHIRRHKSVKQELHKCEECNKAFATPQEIKSHIERAHEKHAHKISKISIQEQDGVFICTQCNKSFEERHMCYRHVLRHLALMKEKVFTCSKCPKKLTSKKFLENHEKWHETANNQKSEVVKCDDCNRTFQNKRILTRHMKRHEALTKGKFQCSVCNERHATQRELTAHAKKHEKKMAVPEGYRAPIVIERNNHSAFKCPDCGLVFDVRRVYYKHAERHINMRNGTYKCDLCGKACGSDKRLYTHMRRHRAGQIRVVEPGELSFECLKCDKKFSKKHLLARHKKFHEAIEKGLHQCKICKKYLGSSGTLAFHEQGHVDKKAKTEYKCAECDRSYARRDAYRCHVRTKHGKSKLDQQYDVKTEES